MARAMIIQVHEHSRTDMLSDILQAEAAILWDRRAAGLAAQLQVHGISMEDAESVLLALAADLHEVRTGQRARAVFLADVLEFLRQQPPFDPERGMALNCPDDLADRALREFGGRS